MPERFAEDRTLQEDNIARESHIFCVSSQFSPCVLKVARAGAY